MWFSKDGRKIAFATFNDTTTPVMSIPQYGTPGSIAFQYTQTVNMRYPKVIFSFCKQQTFIQLQI